MYSKRKKERRHVLGQKKKRYLLCMCVIALPAMKLFCENLTPSQVSEEIIRTKGNFYILKSLNFFLVKIYILRSLNLVKLL